jgi:hypothetical protein
MKQDKTIAYRNTRIVVVPRHTVRAGAVYRAIALGSVRAAAAAKTREKAVAECERQIDLLSL